MEESWHSTPVSTDSSAWIISQDGPNGSSSTPPKLPIKAILIAVVVIIMLAGTGSVVFMISQTTQTLNKAAEKQTNEITSLLDEGTKPDTSFSIVGQVQAQDYQNPVNPDTSYSNPFDDSQNPFK